MNKKIEENKNPSRFRNKSLAIGGIVLLVVLIMVVLLVWRPSLVPTAGEAYRAGPPSVSPGTAKTVYFEYASGFAAPGDTDVIIPLYIKGGLNPPESTIEAIEVCFKVTTWSKFDFISVQATKTGWGRTTPNSDANVPTYLSSPGMIESRCPAGYSSPVDFMLSPTAPQGSAITSGEKFGEIKLGVKTGVSYSTNAPETVEVMTVFVSGATSTATSWSSQLASASSTQITIVPPCPNVDGDGFPATMTLINFDPVKDYRACKSYNAVANAIQPAFDCDDSDAVKFPANPEVCDGKDNDCNDQIDNGLSGSQDNANTKGVCAGKKLCEGNPSSSIAYGMLNSYAITDATIKSRVKANSALDPFVTFIQGTEKKYSFDVYESGNEVSCDGLDNDCDGSIDESILNCQMGRTPLGLKPAGNIHYKYEIDNKLSTAQTINALDISLVSSIEEVRNDVSVGGNNQLPQLFTLMTNLVWLCDDGNYYLKDPTGNYYKYSYNADKQVLTGYSYDINNNHLKNAASTDVQCIITE